MTRLQPHSFVGGSNYNLIGNVAGPKANYRQPNALSGTVTTLAGVGLLTAGSFIYGVVKKKPSELNVGYLGAAFLATLPVATDMWLNNGERYGNLTGKGLVGTYASLIAPPVVAIFAGSTIGNYVAGQRSRASVTGVGRHHRRSFRLAVRRIGGGDDHHRLVPLARFGVSSHLVRFRLRLRRVCATFAKGVQEEIFSALLEFSHQQPVRARHRRR